MVIQLMQGQFKSLEAIEIIEKMFQIKITYHENKITENSNEEDIKNREVKIKRLQKELSELRKYINPTKETLDIDATINIS